MSATVVLDRRTSIEWYEYLLATCELQCSKDVEFKWYNVVHLIHHILVIFFIFVNNKKGKKKHIAYVGLILIRIYD